MILNIKIQAISYRFNDYAHLYIYAYQYNTCETVIHTIGIAILLTHQLVKLSIVYNDLGHYLRVQNV